MLLDRSIVVCPCFKKVGLFDPFIFLYHDDLDFGWREILNLKNKKPEIFENSSLSDYELKIIEEGNIVDNEIINRIDQDHNCKVISNEYPLWISKISFNDINKRSKNLVLFKC